MPRPNCDAEGFRSETYFGSRTRKDAVKRLEFVKKRYCVREMGPCYVSFCRHRVLTHMKIIQRSTLRPLVGAFKRCDHVAHYRFAERARG
jgi:hypothetical protein